MMLVNGQASMRLSELVEVSSGHSSVLIDTSPDDSIRVPHSPTMPCFVLLCADRQGKNRMFVVQVQGKFKKEPEGDLFIALEITERMKLGLLTKVRRCLLLVLTARNGFDPCVVGGCCPRRSS